MQRYFPLLVMVMVVSLASCVTHKFVFNPVPYPIKPEMVLPFEGAGPVALINDQPDKTSKIFCSNRNHEYSGQLNGWTRTAVTMMDRQLTKMGNTVDPSGAKQVRLAIVDVKVFQGAFAFRTILKLRVSTPEGFTQEFEANNAGPTLCRASGGAMTRAVSSALNEEKLRKYLLDQ